MLSYGKSELNSTLYSKRKQATRERQENRLESLKKQGFTSRTGPNGATPSWFPNSGTHINLEASQVAPGGDFKSGACNTTVTLAVHESIRALPVWSALCVYFKI